MTSTHSDFSFFCFFFCSTRIEKYLDKPRSIPKKPQRISLTAMASSSLAPVVAGLDEVADVAAGHEVADSATDKVEEADLEDNVVDEKVCECKIKGETKRG